MNNFLLLIKCVHKDVLKTDKSKCALKYFLTIQLNVRALSRYVDASDQESILFVTLSIVLFIGRSTVFPLYAN